VDCPSFGTPRDILSRILAKSLPEWRRRVAGLGGGNLPGGG
jgi:hypothetical protein